MRRAAKYIYLAWFGGALYVTLEVFWRSRSHWTMFALRYSRPTLSAASSPLWIIRRTCTRLVRSSTATFWRRSKRFMI